MRVPHNHRGSRYPSVSPSPIRIALPVRIALLSRSPSSLSIVAASSILSARRYLSPRLPRFSSPPSRAVPALLLSLSRSRNCLPI
uniref:Uncharacterized protein n=1 Tax=Oryza glumipatula TaxID=40148 RepID=A0A0E0AZY8_9ORYZ